MCILNSVVDLKGKIIKRWQLSIGCMKNEIVRSINHSDNISSGSDDNHDMYG